MQPEFVELLRCPVTEQRLRLEAVEWEGEEIISGSLVADGGGPRWPIHAGIPRFVSGANYAQNFGFQWTTFAKTQLDSVSGHPISADRFWSATGWTEEELRGAWVLDAGCGAGRFASIALRAGARVVAVDYSRAVEACWANLRHFPTLYVAQADIYHLPFPEGAFDFVYSLGVLQHTPDVAAAFAALVRHLKRGGRLCVDVYERSWRMWTHPKYWLRPVTRRMDPGRLFALLERWVPRLLRMSHAAGAIPIVGRYLRRLIPVADYEGLYPLTDRQRLEWALLDTFDWFSPVFDQPQRRGTLERWFREAGFEQVEVLRAGHLVGRGVRPK